MFVIKEYALSFRTNWLNSVWSLACAAVNCLEGHTKLFPSTITRASSHPHPHPSDFQALRGQAQVTFLLFYSLHSNLPLLCLSLHISHRDSKLTHILKQSLGGNARTTTIGTVIPADISETELILKVCGHCTYTHQKCCCKGNFSNLC